MTYRAGVVPLVGLLGLVLAGCPDRSLPPDPPGATRPADESNPEANGQKEAAETSEPSVPDAGENAASAPGDAVTVRVVDETEFAQAVRQYRGKVVLVDYWATWCLSCLELFPHTVDLSKRLADRGLVVISLSMDDPDDAPSVLDRLRSSGATFDNFISRYGGSDKSAEAFGLEDLVLPKYRLYDRTGALHRTLESSTGPIRAEDVDRVVEELLARP